MARMNEHYLGRRVRLKRTITTRSGEVFPKDSVCLVTNIERGKLTLRMKNPDPLNIFGPKRLFVRAVEVWCVELLPHGGLKVPPGEDD